MKYGWLNQALTYGFLALTSSFSLPGCGAAPDDASGGIPSESAESEIVNGDTVGAADVHVMLLTRVPDGNALCSGTILNERWVVTAKHCEATAAAPSPTRLTRGSDTRTAVRVVNHPTLDVTLVEASAAFPSVFQTSMYPWPASRLVGQNVTCFGYGDNTLGQTGAGTLRQGAVRVDRVDTHLVLVPANTRNQIPFTGDSGGGCFSNSVSRALLGVASFVSVTENSTGDVTRIHSAHYVPTSAFSQWALPIIASPTQRLICHGRECISNPRPLPNNLGQEVAWHPCLGQISGPGSYFFDYEISYELERNFDKALVNGAFLTGTGTQTGTSAASHFGNRVGLYTDGSIASNGISWLRARCPGDP